MNYEAARTNMVDGQIHPSGVINPDLLHAFETTPREIFVPKDKRAIAYYDEEITLGNDRFMIEPMILSKMLQELNPQKDQIVLDIGGTTGYAAAILSPLVSTIIALEEDSTLQKQAQKIWNKLDLCNIVAVEGKLKDGVPQNAPYDLIILNGAVAEIPQHICEQLTDGGHLITIVKPAGKTVGQVVKIKALGNNRFSSTALFDAGTSYLSGYEPKTTFTF